jgi:hypothetical protein
MQGKLQNKDEIGIMPRAFDLIFETIESANPEEEEYAVKCRSVASWSMWLMLSSWKTHSCLPTTTLVSYVEVYCERLQDLLGAAKENLKMVDLPGSGVTVQDLTEGE